MQVSIEGKKARANIGSGDDTRLDAQRRQLKDTDLHDPSRLVMFLASLFNILIQARVP